MMQKHYLRITQNIFQIDVCKVIFGLMHQVLMFTLLQDQFPVTLFLSSRLAATQHHDRAAVAREVERSSSDWKNRRSPFYHSAVSTTAYYIKRPQVLRVRYHQKHHVGLTDRYPAGGGKCRSSCA